MKRTVLILTLLLLGISANAQIGRRHHTLSRAVYVEYGGGASLIAGINYDSRFSEDSRWGFRIGIAHTLAKIEEIGVCDGGGDTISGFGENTLHAIFPFFSSCRRKS